MNTPITRNAGESTNVPVPERIGSYRIIDVAGRGGMGVVYKAVQDSLDRVVALKVLNVDAFRSQRHIDRFKREVRAAAKLHHTNIVPVFEFGEADGRHFYSMQFIDGVGLDHLIQSVRETGSFDTIESVAIGKAITKPMLRRTSALAETLEFAPKGIEIETSVVAPATAIKPDAATPTETAANVNSNSNQIGKDAGHYRRVARIGIQIADALQYAHEKGTIHRDVKPHNLLVDRSGVAWLTDFGLAASASASASADSRTDGQIVGTLRYMSPEQLKGEATPQSDIYSLGLTLYELLTTKPAFGGDSESYSFEERLRDHSVAPIRNECRNIPVDLEAIVTKSIATSTDRRYRTSRELADDLRNFISGQPVSARKTTALERTWKWMCRNPALAISLATIFLLLSVFSTMASLGRARVQSLLIESQTSRQLSESRLNLATNAFDDILATYADQRVVAETEFSLDKGALIDAPVTIADTSRLELLLSFYEKFADGEFGDTDLNSKIASAKCRLGDVHIFLGQLDKAEQAYLSAVQWIESRDLQRSNRFSLIEAQTLNELGKISLKKGDIPTALQQHMSALELLRSKEYREQSFRNDVGCFETARTAYLISSIIDRSDIKLEPGRTGRRRSRLNDSPSRRAGAGPAAATAGPPAAGAPGNRRSGETREIFDRIGTLLDLEIPAASTPQTRETVQADFRSLVRLLAQYSVGEFSALVDRHPEEKKYRLALASASQNLASSIVALDRDIAKPCYLKSVALLEELVRESDQDPVFVYELAVCLSQSRKFLDGQQSQENLAKAIKDCRALAVRFPTNYEFEYVESLSKAELAAVLKSDGQFDRAEDLLRDAIDQQRKLVEQVPDRSSLRLVLAQGRQQLVDVLVLKLEATTTPDEQAAIEAEILETLQRAIADLDHPTMEQTSGFLRGRIENDLRAGLRLSKQRSNRTSTSKSKGKNKSKTSPDR